MDLTSFSSIALSMIGIIAVLIISIVCAMVYNRENFSNNVFLCAFAIGVGVLIWIGVLPIFTVALSALCLLGIVFSGRNEP